MNAYAKRISDKFVAWREDPKYYTPLLEMAKDKWVNIPVLHDFLGEYPRLLVLSPFLSF